MDVSCKRVISPALLFAIDKSLLSVLVDVGVGFGKDTRVRVFQILLDVGYRLLAFPISRHLNTSVDGSFFIKPRI